MQALSDFAASLGDNMQGLTWARCMKITPRQRIQLADLLLEGCLHRPHRPAGTIRPCRWGHIHCLTPIFHYRAIRGATSNQSFLIYHLDAGLDQIGCHIYGGGGGSGGNLGVSLWGTCTRWLAGEHTPLLYNADRGRHNKDAVLTLTPWIHSLDEGNNRGGDRLVPLYLSLHEIKEPPSYPTVQPDFWLGCAAGSTSAPSAYSDFAVAGEVGGGMAARLGKEGNQREEGRQHGRLFWWRARDRLGGKCG